jgi:myosin heavy subunit
MSNIAHPTPPCRYAELQAALDVVGFSGDEQENLHRVIAALLRMGNVTYDAVYGDRDPAGDVTFDFAATTHGG